MKKFALQVLFISLKYKSIYSTDDKIQNSIQLSHPEINGRKRLIKNSEYLYHMEFSITLDNSSTLVATQSRINSVLIFFTSSQSSQKYIVAFWDAAMNCTVHESLDALSTIQVTLVSNNYQVICLWYFLWQLFKHLLNQMFCICSIFQLHIIISFVSHIFPYVSVASLPL